ncbi:uncharacterized protein LOC119386541 isoform X1 [Rhipicephalus sanguineus]|uniref:uncharacterized protein LOC119386541 isoform X1 n=1 Tax=Rhipicephalus sanguineus TaxID=34632 RepID=UPI00189621C4|nr:uncharacterized protein LOC119386541 isoform X1 [Rhipicephalus sanguineus]
MRNRLSTHKAITQRKTRPQALPSLPATRRCRCCRFAHLQSVGRQAERSAKYSIFFCRHLKNEARFQRRVLAYELLQGCYKGFPCKAAHNRWHIGVVAQHQGYVKVNWSRLNKDLQQAQNELARRTDGKLPRLLEEGQKFVKDNVFLATGFAGGFLLGVASS